MSGYQVISINGILINEYGFSPRVIVSKLDDGWGLPAARVLQSQRYGRWPIIAGLERPGLRLTLHSYLYEGDPDPRRANLWVAMNPESEDVYRLIQANHAIPVTTLVAWGPLDLYHQTDGSWIILDVLNGIEAVITGERLTDWETSPGVGFVFLQQSAIDASSYTETGDDNNQLSGYQNVTGLNFNNTDNGTLYIEFAKEDSTATVTFYKDSGRTLLVASTNVGVGTGAQTLFERNGSGIGGTITIDAIVATDLDIEVEYDAIQAAYLSALSADIGAARAADFWWTPEDSYTFVTDRFLLDANPVRLFYRASDDKFVLTDGTTTIASAVQTFPAGSPLHVCGIWGTDGVALSVNGVVTSGSGNLVSLPTTLYIGCKAEGDGNFTKQPVGEIVAARFYSALSTSQAQTLHSAGIPYDGYFNSRWLTVLCESSVPDTMGGDPVDCMVLTRLIVDKDIRWRSRSSDYEVWNVTTSPDTTTVDNQGTDDAYPIFYVTPRGARSSGGFLYKNHFTIQWNADESYTNYPVNIVIGDISTWAQADGDDVRVYVDGTEIDRWLPSGTVMTAAELWCNISFEANQEALLELGIPASGAIDQISCTTTINNFPSSGLLLIDSEVFRYTGKNNSLQTFTGISRAETGTSEVAHSAGATIQWIQHEVVVYYGDSTLSAPTVNNAYKPAFNLESSSNTSWVYPETGSVFGSDTGLRPGSWQWSLVSGSSDPLGDVYTIPYTNGDPWEIAGIETKQTFNKPVDQASRWTIYNPCKINSANYTKITYIVASNDGTDIQIIATQNNSIWTSLTTLTLIRDGLSHDIAANPSQPSNNKGTGVFVISYSGTATTTSFVFIQLATLGIGGDAPTLTKQAQQSNYTFDFQLENTTTGARIDVLLGTELDATLVIDTDQKLVYSQANDASRISAITVYGGARKDWLKLQPGENEIQYTETGVTDVDIDIVWDRRTMQ